MSSDKLMKSNWANLVTSPGRRWCQLTLVLQFDETQLPCSISNLVCDCVLFNNCYVIISILTFVWFQKGHQTMLWQHKARRTSSTYTKSTIHLWRVSIVCRLFWDKHWHLTGLRCPIMPNIMHPGRACDVVPESPWYHWRLTAWPKVDL